MARRTIGQERFSFSKGDKRSGLDALSELIDWREADSLLSPISDAAKGEQGWPPLCLLKALLLARWYDLSDVKPAEALDDRASFHRFCGFAALWPSWNLAKNCSRRSRINYADSGFR